MPLRIGHMLKRGSPARVVRLEHGTAIIDILDSLASLGSSRDATVVIAHIALDSAFRALLKAETNLVVALCQRWQDVAKSSEHAPI